MVGNDIVDLGYLEPPAYRHVRYLSRVCTPAEARSVMDSQDPCRSLAIVWAAKEATYKLLASGGNLPHFIPRRFSLDHASLRNLTCECPMKVTYEGMEATRVEIKATSRWVHAIATFREFGVVRWSVQEIDQRLNNGHAAKVESEAVRKLAAELLSKCGERDVVLEFVKKIPTLRRRLGGLLGTGISLSHHGAFAAVAITWPLGEPLLDESHGVDFLQGSSRRKMCSTFTA